MQKKKLYQLAAAIVLVVAVAAALILTGMRKSTPVSEAQASSVPSSAPVSYTHLTLPTIA